MVLLPRSLFRVYDFCSLSKMYFCLILWIISVSRLMIKIYYNIFQCLFNMNFLVFIYYFMVWFLLDLGSGDIEVSRRNGADCIVAFGEGED